MSGADCDTNDKLYAFVREKSASAYHPSCTCKMGDPAKDPMTVVDSSTRFAHSLSKRSRYSCQGNRLSLAAICRSYFTRLQILRKIPVELIFQNKE